MAGTAELHIDIAAVFARNSDEMQIRLVFFAES
jgi:hypothetical protein